MKQIRTNKNYTLYRTDDKMYQVCRKKDKKRSELMTKDEAETLILDEGFNKECEQLKYS